MGSAQSLNIEVAGGRVLALGTATLCGIALYCGDQEGSLFPIAWQGPALAVLLAKTIGSALLAICNRGGRLAWLPLGVFWTVQIISGVAVLQMTLASFVAPMQALVIALAICRVARWLPDAFIEPSLIAAGALTLALFGLVHLQNTTFIAGLAPSWIPGRSIVPIATGTLLLTAAVCLLRRRTREIGALGVAVMFLSWLPIVHAGRLASAPRDLGEWRFALTALTLVGAFAIVSGRIGLSVDKT